MGSLFWEVRSGEDPNSIRPLKNQVRDRGMFMSDPGFTTMAIAIFGLIGMTLTAAVIRQLLLRREKVHWEKRETQKRIEEITRRDHDPGMI